MSVTDIANWRDRELHTVAAAQGILQISRPLAYRLIASGKLPSIRVGNALRVRTRDLVRLIDGTSKREAA